MSSEISNEELKNNMSKFIGRELWLVAPHSHAGHKGVFHSLDTDDTGKPFFNILLDDGRYTIVSKNVEVKVAPTWF